MPSKLSKPAVAGGIISFKEVIGVKGQISANSSKLGLMFPWVLY